MKRIITISREYGAGGGEIGKRLADELGYEYYDKSMILGVAREANVDVDHADKWDEVVPRNFGFAQSLFDFYNRPLSEKLFQAQSKVIKAFAAYYNYINTLHIRLEFFPMKQKKMPILDHLQYGHL